MALTHASAAPPALATAPDRNPAQVPTPADQAQAAALAQFPGATVAQVELQDENGAPVWGVTLTDASGAAQDVTVDGTSGQVLSAQADGPDGAEGPETPGNERQTRPAAARVTAGHVDGGGAHQTSPYDPGSCRHSLIRIRLFLNNGAHCWPSVMTLRRAGSTCDRSAPANAYNKRRAISEWRQDPGAQGEVCGGA